MNQSVWDKAFFNFQTAIFLCRLKALVLTKLKCTTANHQSTNRVRTVHALRVGFEVTVGVWRNHARNRLSIQTTVC